MLSYLVIDCEITYLYVVNIILVATKEILFICFNEIFMFIYVHALRHLFKKFEQFSDKRSR